MPAVYHSQPAFFYLFQGDGCSGESFVFWGEFVLLRSLFFTTFPIGYNLSLLLVSLSLLSILSVLLQMKMALFPTAILGGFWLDSL